MTGIIRTDDEAAAVQSPPGGWGGWLSFEENYPLGFYVVEVWREGWNKPERIRLGSFSKSRNIHQLYWRPWQSDRPDGATAKDNT